MSKAIEDVKKERARQDSLWGTQEHRPYVWLSILMEEVGETAQAAMEADHLGLTSNFGNLDHYREEMVQVAAVAIAAVESLDRQLGN